MKLHTEAVPAALRQFFAGQGRIALAFSGGCDSAYLFYAALACGADVKAYYVKTPFQPAFELEDARKLAAELGGEMTVIETDVLSDDRIRANPADRCYFCKQRIFSCILEAARRDGCICVIDGTNASDDAADRPGMRALREMQVRSPLRECGVTKGEVRRLSKEAGLFTWNKPAYACLATRIPAGTAITAEALQKTEHAEALLSSMGFSDFRVRLEGGGARLELTEEQLPLLLERRKEILAALEDEFNQITLNLQTRKGLNQ